MATYVDSVLEPGEIVRYRTTVTVDPARGHRVGNAGRWRNLHDKGFCGVARSSSPWLPSAISLSVLWI
jgi:hypothetical protein